MTDRRKVEFRVWDKRRGRFHFGCDNLCLTLSGHLMWQFGFNSPNLLGEDELADYGELQQYTGLKDLNGVAICEGDILAWCSPSVSERWVVEPTSGGWNPFIDSMTTDKPHRYQVIGNIYENPELIKETQ